MKSIICMLTAFTALIVWPTPAIAQEEKQGGEKTAVVEYTGKVLRVDRGDPAMVVVKTDKTDLNVELAPMTFIESSKLSLAPNSEVTVRGYDTIRDGRSVFVATEVTSQGKRGEVARRRAQPALDGEVGGGGSAGGAHLHVLRQGQDLPERGPRGRHPGDREGTHHGRARSDDVHRSEQTRSRAE